MREAALFDAYRRPAPAPNAHDVCSWDGRAIVALGGTDAAIAAAVARHQATPEHRGARVRLMWRGELVAPEAPRADA